MRTKETANQKSNVRVTVMYISLMLKTFFGILKKKRRIVWIRKKRKGEYYLVAGTYKSSQAMKRPEKVKTSVQASKRLMRDR